MHSNSSFINARTNQQQQPANTSTILAILLYDEKMEWIIYFHLDRQLLTTMHLKGGQTEARARNWWPSCTSRPASHYTIIIPSH
jgi:hypothetical protein